MYYKERIIGAITYGILLLLFSLLIKKDRIPLKKMLFLYVIVLSVFAYLYIPNPGYDLERIYLSLYNYYRPMSPNLLFNVLEKSYTPTINIFYFIVSKTNHFGLVPFCASFIFYSCTFSVFSDVCIKYNICGLKRSLFLIFLMCLGTYLEVIANIRCMTAFSMITYCSYNEIFNDKSIVKNLPIYLIAGTMHLAALAMIILRFALYPLQKKKGKLFYAIIPFSILMIIYIFFPNFIEQIFFTESYYKENVAYTYTPEFVLMSIMTLYIVFIKIIHWKHIISCEYELKSINYFAIVLLIIIILNVNDYSMFHRIGTLHFLTNIPIMGKYLSLINLRNSMMVMFLVSAIVLAIAATLGNLCGFKYFIFG